MSGWDGENARQIKKRERNICFVAQVCEIDAYTPLAFSLI